jgi:hypothetical protein
MSLCECGCGQDAGVYPQSRTVDGIIKGQPRRYLNYHVNRLRGKRHPGWKGGKGFKSKGYEMVFVPDHPRGIRDCYVPEQILMVEKVLGHFLPLKALVHHVDGVKDHNKNANFVICQNGSYHTLIEMRARALRECGDVHKRKCPFCHQYDLISNLVSYNGLSHKHRACINAYGRNHYKRKDLSL